MKTYYYSLNEKNRISHITEEVIDYYDPIELTDQQFKSIVLFRTGIKNNKLVDMGEDQEMVLLNKKIDLVNKIEDLKELLFITDWKVAVNSEYIQAGLEPKYPNLHKERQAWRDEINKLERDLEV